MRTDVIMTVVPTTILGVLTMLGVALTLLSYWYLLLVAVCGLGAIGSLAIGLTAIYVKVYAEGRKQRFIHMYSMMNIHE